MEVHLGQRERDRNEAKKHTPNVKSAVSELAHRNWYINFKAQKRKKVIILESYETLLS